MKLIVILLTAASLQVAARGNAQTVTYSGREVSLKEVFTAIKKQTGFVVLFDYDMLNNSKPVTISASNQPLGEFLDKALTGQQLDFSIHQKTIFIRKRPVVYNAPTAVTTPITADPRPIRGHVHDAKGSPLAGASIILKGTQKGISVGSDGSFNVEANIGDVLVVSLIGYITAEYKITGNVANITLTPSIVKLDDVEVTVNTGYQRIRPEQSTGAIAQITTKEFESRVSTSFIDGLVNKLPGLMINNDITFSSNINGASSSRSLFSIRGISTMSSASANPLIVVDGYPTELALNMIDPNEIKSVTILKDAAAATVYGVRASNGVIVIERKQAAIGKPRITFRATSGFTAKPDFSRYRWAADGSAISVAYQKDLYSKSINANTWGTMSTNNTLGKASYSPVYYILAQQAANMITPDQANQSLDEMRNYNNMDEYSRLFLHAALTQTYNANVSGGNNNALYYITANYTKNRLINIKNDNNRFLLSGRSTIKFARRFSLELTTDYLEQNDNSAPVNSASNLYEHYVDKTGKPAAVTAGSVINPFYNATIMGQGLLDNLFYPLQEVNEVSDKIHTVNNKFTANFKYDIGRGFDIQFGGIYEKSRGDVRHLASENSAEVRQLVNAYTDTLVKPLRFNIPKGGLLKQTVDNTSSFTGRAQLNYNKKIATDHSINGIIGAEIRNVKSNGNSASYFGYNDQTLYLQAVDWASINTGALKSSFGFSSPLQNMYPYYFYQTYNESRFLSGYSNIVYSYKNTYSATASARIDQSNLFGTNPKYKYKPLWSVGAAWNLHNEEFIRNISWINMLKLRAAYGFNGNVAKNSLPQVIAGTTGNYLTSPSTTALTRRSYANSSLRWEQTKNINIGIDYRVAKNVYGTLDYYQKISTDVMGNSQIDPTIGISPTPINMASITNKGLELSLHADWIATKKVNWNTGFVISRNISNVTDVYQSFKTTDNALGYNPYILNGQGFVKGRPVGALFAYRYGGLDSIGYPLVVNTKGTAYHTNIATTGTPSYYTLTADTSNIVYYMGTSIPTITAGISNRVDIGNFYVYCMVNYYGGFKVRVPRPNPSVSQPLEGAGNYWKQPGDEKTTDVMALAGYTSVYANYAYNYSDKYVVNGDYITLADLTVSYSLDNMAFVKKANLTHLEVKLQGSNLYTVGLNKYNYSAATGAYEKKYVTPTYTLAIFANL